MKTMNDIELKPCPFCGGEAELIYSNDNHHKPYIACKFGSMLTPKCSAYNTYQWNYKTVAEAVEAWNRRV